MKKNLVKVPDESDKFIGMEFDITEEVGTRGNQQVSSYEFEGVFISERGDKYAQGRLTAMSGPGKANPNYRRHFYPVSSIVDKLEKISSHKALK